MESLSISPDAKTMENIALEYLGSGYDVCGEYADAVSIKKKLFDLNRVPKKDIRRLPNRSADFFSVVGKTVEEYQQSLTIKAGVNGSYGLFSGSVETSFTSTDLSIAESSYVSIELCMRYDTWKLQNTDTKYMYPDVLNDFKTKEGKWLIEQYGGYVVMGMDIGGRWIDNLAVSKLYENSTTQVSVAMEAAYGAVLSGHGSTEVSETIKRETSIANRKVNVIGGNPAFAPGKMEEWQKSVEDNPALMNIPPDGFVAIWELFPQYEDKLKKGFNEYVKDHQLNITKINIIKGTYVEGEKYSSSAGSGAHQIMDVYKPTLEPRDPWNYVGVNGYDNKVLVLREYSNQYGALREPTAWQPVWNDRGSRRDKDYSCWMPVGPPDFVALGIFCRFRAGNNHPPSKEEAEGLMVVHRSLVEPCNFATDNVWSDRGSRAKHDVTLGRLPHKALWPFSTNDPEAGVLPSKYTLKKEYMKDIKDEINEAHSCCTLF